MHCRARFRFTELKELYKMTQIGEADGVKIATTFPQQDDEYQTVSIYWTLVIPILRSLWSTRRNYPRAASEGQPVGVGGTEESVFL